MASFNLTAQLNLQGPSNLKKVAAQIRSELGAATTTIDLKVDPKASKSIQDVTSKITELNRALSVAAGNAVTLNKALSGLSSGFGAAGRSNKEMVSGLRSASVAASKVASSSKDAGDSVDILSGRLSDMAKKGLEISIVSRAFNAFTTSISSSVGKAIEFETQMRKVAQVSGASNLAIQNLRSTITNLSTGLGVASDELAEVAVTLGQAGIVGRELEVVLSGIAKTNLAPTFTNMKQTTEGVIAAMGQFGIAAKDMERSLGSINAVAGQFAVESSDIIAAIQRTGGVFAAASKGVSEPTKALNEFVAVFTAVRASSRESAETIAAGLKTIFGRIQRSETIDYLEQFGVKLRDAKGDFIGAYNAIDELGKKLSGLDPRDARYSKIVEELGGIRQIGKVIPLLEQVEKRQKALKEAEKGGNSLGDAAAKAQETLAVKLIQTREAWLALAREFTDNAGFKAVTTLVLGLANAGASLLSAFKPLFPIFTLLATLKIGQGITSLIGAFLGGKKPGGGGGLGGLLGGGGGLLPGGGGAAADRDGKTQAVLKSIDAVNSNTSALGTLTSAVKDLTSEIKTLPSSSPKKLNQGGAVHAFARGGVVPGSGNSDTVKAVLTPGEFVIRKKAVEAIGADKLHQMNRYAGGGVVSAALGDLSSIQYDDTVQMSDKASTIINPFVVKLGQSDFANMLDTMKNNEVNRQEMLERFSADPSATGFLNYMRSPNGQWAKGAAFEEVIAKRMGIAHTTAMSGEESTFAEVKANHFAPLDFATGDAKFVKDTSKYLSQAKGQKEILSKKFRYDLNQGKLDPTPNIDNFDMTRDPVTVYIPEKGAKEKFDKFVDKNKGWQENATLEFLSKSGAFDSSDWVNRALGGPILQTDTVGAAIMEDIESYSPSVTAQDIAAATSKGKQNEQQVYDQLMGLLGTRSYTIRKSGLGTEVNKLLKEKMGSGSVDMVNSILESMGAQTVEGDENQANLLTTMNAGMRGAVFETILTAMKQGGVYATASKSNNDYFDYTSGLGAAAKLFEGLEGLNFVDAKLSLKSASNANIARKIGNEILRSSSGLSPEQVAEMAPEGDIAAKFKAALVSSLGSTKVYNQGRKIALPGSPGALDTTNKSASDIVAGLYTQFGLSQDDGNKLLGQIYKITNSKNFGPGFSLRDVIQRFETGGLVTSQTEEMMRKLHPSTLVKLARDPSQDSIAKAAAYILNEQGGYKSPVYGSGSGSNGIMAARYAIGGRVSDEFLKKYKGKGIDWSDVWGTYIVTKQGPSITANGNVKRLSEFNGDEALIEEFIRRGNLALKGYQSSPRRGYGSGSMRLRTRRRYAEGGSAEDTVPALLTPGEFVINKESAARIGSANLNKLNHADKLQGFNKGGAVGFVRRFAGGGAAGPDDPRRLAYYADQAEKAGMSLDQFIRSLKLAAHETAVKAKEDREAARATLKTGVLRGSSSGLRGAGEMNSFAANLGASLQQMLPDMDASDLQAEADAIAITIADTGASFEELVDQFGSLKQAMDASLDTQMAVNSAQEKLADTMGGLISAVESSTGEFENLEKGKEMFPSLPADIGADLRDSPIGQMIDTIRTKMDQFGASAKGLATKLNPVPGLMNKIVPKGMRDKLSAAGSGFSKMLPSMNNLASGAKNVIGKLGGLPNILAGFASIAGDAIQKSSSTQLGAGVGGALKGAGSGAMSASMLGMLIPGIGPFAVAVGAAVGALKGFIQGMREKRLSMAMDSLAKSTIEVDKAFAKLDLVNSAENMRAARVAVAGQAGIGDELFDIGKVDALDKAGAALEGAFSWGAAGLAAAGVAAAAAFGVLTAGVGFAIIGVAGLAMGAVGLANAADELDNEALAQAAVNMQKLNESIEKLATRDLKTLDVADLVKYRDELDEALRSPNGAKNFAGYDVMADQRARISLAQQGLDQGLTKSPLNEQNLSAEQKKIVEQAKKQYYLQLAQTRLIEEAGGGEEGAAKGRKAFNKLSEQQQLELGKRTSLEKGSELLTTAASEAALQEAQRNTEVLEREFGKVAAAIARFSHELGKFTEETELRAAAFKGQAQLIKASSKDSTVLGNLRAYSQEEVAATASRVGRTMGGRTGDEVQNAINAKRVIQEELPAILANTGSQDINEVTSKLNDLFEGQGIGEGARKQLVQEIRDSLEAQTGGTRQQKTYEELSREFAGLETALTGINAQYEAGVKAMEAFDKAIQIAHDRVADFGAMMQEQRKYNLAGDKAGFSGINQIRESLGMELNLQEMNAPFMAEMQSLLKGTGAEGAVDFENSTVNPAQMRDAFMNLQDTMTQQRADIEGYEGDKTSKEYLDMVKNLQENINASENLRDAMELNASDTSRLTNILAIQQRSREQRDRATGMGKEILGMDSAQRAQLTSQLAAAQLAISKSPEADAQRAISFQSVEARRDAMAGVDRMASFMNPADARKLQAQSQLNMFRATNDPMLQARFDVTDKNGNIVNKTLEEILTEQANGSDNFVDAAMLQVDQQVITNKILASMAGEEGARILAEAEAAQQQAAEKLPAMIDEARTPLNTPGMGGAVAQTENDAIIRLSAALERQRQTQEQNRTNQEQLRAAEEQLAQAMENWNDHKTVSNKEALDAAQANLEQKRANVEAGGLDVLQANTDVQAASDVLRGDFGNMDTYETVEQKAAQIMEDSPQAKSAYDAMVDLQREATNGQSLDTHDHTLEAILTEMSANLSAEQNNAMIVDAINNNGAQLTAVAQGISSLAEIMKSVSGNGVAETTVPTIQIEQTSLDSLSAFNTSFGGYVTRLEQVAQNLPDTIQMVGRHSVAVTVAGADQFKSEIEDWISGLIMTSIGNEARKLWQKTDGQLGAP